GTTWTGPLAAVVGRSGRRRARAAGVGGGVDRLRSTRAPGGRPGPLRGGRGAGGRAGRAGRGGPAAADRRGAGGDATRRGCGGGPGGGGGGGGPGGRGGGGPAWVWRGQGGPSRSGRSPRRACSRSTPRRSSRCPAAIAAWSRSIL